MALPPVYWKNGVKTELPSPAPDKFGVANGIALAGNDIYICGAYTLPSGKLAACYWKNGAIFTLEGNATDSRALSIAVDGIDIHIAGYAAGTFAPEPVATYWKNNQITTLYHTTTSSVANQVTVSNGDVYIAGTDQLATYWKNGNVFNLPDEYGSGAGTAIAVKDGVVYTGGSYSYLNSGSPTPGYWMNNTLVKLPLPSFGMGSYLSGTCTIDKIIVIK